MMNMTKQKFTAVTVAALLLFTGASVAEKDASPHWDTRSDTWVATDGLGRSLPTHEQVGPPREGKYVGIFYFLWLGQHGQEGPFDNSKILAEDPEAIHDPNHPLWGPLRKYHHWGRPLFGYYLSNDQWVLRKHAQMLADAQVDTLIFDVTNGFTYQDNYLALCRVFTEVREKGGATPQIMFLTPFANPTSVVESLYENLYKPGLYEDLWFRWEGKPLIMADPDALGSVALVRRHNEAVELEEGRTVGQSFVAERAFTAAAGRFPTWGSGDSAMTLTLYRGGPEGEKIASQRFEDVADSAVLFLELSQPLPPGEYYLEMSEPTGRIGWWSQTEDTYPDGQAHADGESVGGDRMVWLRHDDRQREEMLEFFTFRKPNPSYFTGPSGPREWGWLDVYPQKPYWVEPGVPEQITVGVAQNAVDGKLSVLSNPRSHGRSFHDGRQLGPEGQDYFGRNFAEQWEHALEVDPAFIFITGWNEWIAMRFGQEGGYGRGPVSFMDAFNPEYSRDAEPMTGGHEDAYYYQMIDYIRRFKGAREMPRAGEAKTIDIDGGFDQWKDVMPEFRDDISDTAHRHHPGWGAEGMYSNTTGRNDFVLMKVAHDDEFLYFYAQTREPITPHTDPHWMMLFIDADQDHSTGWEGYDFVINRQVIDERTTMVESAAGGWDWQEAARVRYRLEGNELHLAVPRAALGLDDPSRPFRFDFKWADNMQAADAMEFYLSGDAAPNGRFNYRYEAPD